MRKNAISATPHFDQQKLYTCAPAALRMVFHFYGIEKTEQEIERSLQTTEEHGTPLSKILEYAKRMGFSVFHKDGANFEDIEKFLAQGKPVIVNYREPENEQGHFAVVVSIDKERLVMNDPWHGPNYTLDKKEFVGRWHNIKMNRERTIVVLTPQKKN